MSQSNIGIGIPQFGVSAGLEHKIDALLLILGVSEEERAFLRSIASGSEVSLHAYIDWCVEHGYNARLEHGVRMLKKSPEDMDLEQAARKTLKLAERDPTCGGFVMRSVAVAVLPGDTVQKLVVRWEEAQRDRK